MVTIANLKFKKYLFFLIWILIVFSGPYTVLINSSLSSVTRDSVNLLNFLQRMSGVLLFSLLFTQIILGSQMDKLNQIIGAKAYWFHITQGVAIFFLVLFHPLMELAITYQISKSIVETLAVFLPSLKSQREIYLTYAKVAVVLLFMTIGAGYFRTKKLLRKHWHTIHLFNYVVFYLIYLHMRVGEDIMFPPFIWVTWLALGLVTLSVILRLKSAFLPQKR